LHALVAEFPQCSKGAIGVCAVYPGGEYCEMLARTSIAAALTHTIDLLLQIASCSGFVNNVLKDGRAMSSAWAT
jgi:hypothetical protein